MSGFMLSLESVGDFSPSPTCALSLKYTNLKKKNEAKLFSFSVLKMPTFFKTAVCPHRMYLLARQLFTAPSHFFLGVQA